MSPGVGNGGDVVYTAIHFSDRFPVVRTACGKLGPSAAQWRYVDCLECLDAGPDDPRIGKRRAEIIARARELAGEAPAGGSPSYR